MSNEIKKVSSYKKFMQKMERKMPASHMILKYVPLAGAALFGAAVILKAPVIAATAIIARLAIPVVGLMVFSDKINSFIGSKLKKTTNNEGNQKIKASRYVLNQLEVAQEQITKAAIKNHFNDKSEISQSDKVPVAEIVRDVKHLIGEVSVLENRDKEFSDSKYEFTVPVNNKKVPLRKFLKENKF